MSSIPLSTDSTTSSVNPHTGPRQIDPRLPQGMAGGDRDALGGTPAAAQPPIPRDHGPRGVIEAIKGPSRVPRLQISTNSRLKPGSPKRSPTICSLTRNHRLRPTLQISVEQVLELAREEDFTHPRFTASGYLTLERTASCSGTFSTSNSAPSNSGGPSRALGSGARCPRLSHDGKALRRNARSKIYKTRYARNGEAVGDLSRNARKVTC